MAARLNWNHAAEAVRNNQAGWKKCAK